MQSALNPAHNDPHDVLEIAPDIVLVARAEEELSKLAARDAKTRAPQPQEPAQPKQDLVSTEVASVPPIDTGFRATAVNPGRRSRGGRAIRGFFGVLLAVLVGGAVLTLKVSGDVAQQVIVAWLPQFAARSAPPDTTAPAPAQSVATAEPAATAAPASPQLPPAEANAQNSATPAAAAQTPDQAQMMQSMAHHLANVGQELEELKAQVAELKASQEQMSRDMAKAAEQKPKLSALPARPAAPLPRKPPPTSRPAQSATAPMTPPPAAAYPPPAASPNVPPAAASPYAPAPQATVQAPYDPNAPRPPMPVRE